jgi:chromosome segregation ATPase
MSSNGTFTHVTCQTLQVSENGQCKVLTVPTLNATSATISTGRMTNLNSTNLTATNGRITGSFQIGTQSLTADTVRSLNAYATRLGTAETTLTSHTSSLRTLQGQILTVNSSNNSNSSSISSLRNLSGSHSSSINSLITTVGRFNTTLTSQANRLTALETQGLPAPIVSQLNELTTKTSQHDTSIASLQSTANQTSISLATLNPIVSALQTKVSSIETVLESGNFDLPTGLESRLTSLESELSDVKEYLGILASHVILTSNGSSVLPPT